MKAFNLSPFGGKKWELKKVFRGQMLAGTRLRAALRLVKAVKTAMLAAWLTDYEDGLGILKMSRLDQGLSIKINLTCRASGKNLDLDCWGWSLGKSFVPQDHTIGSFGSFNIYKTKKAG